MVDSQELARLALYFGAVVALIGLMLLLAFLLGQRRTTRATAHPFESGMMPVTDAHLRFPIQFYLLAMFFVVFDLETVFILAWAVAARESGWQGFIEISVFVAILLAALAYLWRIGALDWGPRRKSSFHARD